MKDFVGAAGFLNSMCYCRNFASTYSQKVIRLYIGYPFEIRFQLFLAIVFNFLFICGLLSIWLCLGISILLFFV